MSEQQNKWNESFKAGRDYNPMNQILLDSILDAIQNEKKHAIDLGCGTGDAVIKLAQSGMFVTGMDWSSDALEKAEQRVKLFGVENISFKEADLNKLEQVVIENSADVILSKLVIAFVEDKKKFCTTVKSLLSKDGVFIIQTPVLHDGIQYSPEDKPGIAVKYKEFNALLNDVFSEVNEFNHSYYGDKGDLVTYIVK
jgi:ubiquinone/menaquinone biosynthesis C-methylase UbiE